MKLLLTADTVGGVWTYGLELIAGLARAAPEVEITFATLGGLPGADQRAELARLGLPPERVFHSPARLEWMDEPWADVETSGRWLLDLARQCRPDVVHLNTSFAHGALPWPAPVLLVGHSCVRSWWQAVNGVPAPPAWDFYRERVTAGLRAANGVAAPSRAMLAALQEHYGPLRNARVLPNGRGPRPELRPGEKEPVIFAAGRLWDEAKNVAALARVAPELPCPVEVAGEADSPDGRPFRPPPGLRLLGRVGSEEVARRMRRAMIFAAPARYEPFGLAILEAALCGCSLVLGDIPSLRELWDGAAVFVDPADDRALADALRELLAAPARRAALADASLTRARERTAARMARESFFFYQALTAPSWRANLLAAAAGGPHPG